VVALAACMGHLADAGQPTAAAAGTATWLERLNEYRSESGLAAVSPEPSWSAGIVDHLNYLANTPPELRTGEYSNMHEQNPASPFSTPQGALAAQSANLGYADDPSEAIDQWMTSPFHALGLLRPGLRRSAFGQVGRAVGLDVLRGNEAAPPQQVLFPGDGAIVDVDAYSGHESPTPMESCVDTAFRGLPIVAMLTAAPSEQLTASLTMPDGRVLRTADELCVVTSSTYRSTDPLYAGLGLELLRGSNAVFVIPRQPLARGAYTVQLAQPSRPTISWRFGVGSSSVHEAFVGPGTPLRVRAGSPGSTVIGT
jgi:hypothetical protein